jgi:hypothetical protein
MQSENQLDGTRDLMGDERITHVVLWRSQVRALMGRRCYGMCKNRVRCGSEQEKAQYGASSASEEAPFEGRVESSSSHPLLRGQSEGKGSYSVRSSDVPVWYVFLVILVLKCAPSVYIYIYIY